MGYLVERELRWAHEGPDTVAYLRGRFAGLVEPRHAGWSVQVADVDGDPVEVYRVRGSRQDAEDALVDAIAAVAA